MVEERGGRRQRSGETELEMEVVVVVNESLKDGLKHCGGRKR